MALPLSLGLCLWPTRFYNRRLYEELGREYLGGTGREYVKRVTLPRPPQASARLGITHLPHALCHYCTACRYRQHSSMLHPTTTLLASPSTPPPRPPPSKHRSRQRQGTSTSGWT
eukprot:943738-Rhodomonas_salina.2